MNISVHRLRCGLLGYLILFAPHNFVPQCQFRLIQCLRSQPSYRVSTRFISTPLICQTSIKLQSYSTLIYYLLSFQTTCGPFTPIQNDQRSHFSFSRVCWHEDWTVLIVNIIIINIYYIQTFELFGRGRIRMLLIWLVSSGQLY